MTLHVTNTLTGEREPFEPQDPDDVLLYYCGLTVSDPPHLGHARSWVHVDVMHRWLTHRGFDVRHVENFTDVNEKIVARIGSVGEDEAAVAVHYIAETIDAMRSLNLLRADVYPRVSTHVPEIIDLIETLIENGHAYEANGSVYFDVTSYPEYGKLSNQRVDDIEAQGEPDEIEEKRHPADFALWKADGVSPSSIAEHRDPDLEPLDGPCGETWESPWGPGRPGWHIECSAMSQTHLGETIDLHVGGQDLVFPHHENEIAQSEAATGERFVKYWLHTRLLETGGDKMSSSLKNFFTVENAVEAFGTNAVRMFLLSTSYANTQTYTEAALAEAVERWERVERGYERAVQAADTPEAHTRETDETFRAALADAREAIESGMDDDFNTREGLAGLLDVVTAVNKHVDDVTAYDYEGLRDAIDAFETYGEAVFGFQFTEPTDGSAQLAGELVELVLSLRAEERERGNYERADELRDALESLGVTVEDDADGTTFRL